MKKVLFTIQMMALVAVIPVYLVTELNHKTAKLPANNSQLESIQQQEKSNIQPALNPESEGMFCSSIIMNTYYLNL